MIKVKHKGNFRNTERFFAQAPKAVKREILETYGQAGVTALASATPVDSGETAAAWGYEIVQTSGGYSILDKFSHQQRRKHCRDSPIRARHRHGRLCERIDYINPALRPVVFEQLADAASGGEVMSS